MNNRTTTAADTDAISSASASTFAAAAAADLAVTGPSKPIATGNCRGVALVTGSSSGIGASVAIDLASIGFIVILTGRNSDNLAKIEQKCNDALKSNGFGGKSISYKIDFNSVKQLDELICFVRSKFNKLDVLINNVCWRGEIKDILADGVLDDFQKALYINVLLPLRLIRELCLTTTEISGETSSLSASLSGLFSANKKTIVINISSIAAQIAVPLHVYSISKACLSELSRQIGLLADMTRDEQSSAASSSSSSSSSLSNILSVTVSPGPVLTDERPHHAQMSRWTLMDRVASTQEISNLVIFLVDRAAHLFNGQEINIDGGYMAKQKQTTTSPST